MRRSLTMFGLIAALAASASADWKITTAVESPWGRSVSTEYFKGARHRTDQNSSVSVVDSDSRRETVWSSAAREYLVLRLRAAAPHATTPGALIIIRQTTTDTGESRTYFGRTAHRFFTTEESCAPSRTGVPGPLESRKTVDGWYVDSNTMPRQVRASARPSYLLIGGGEFPRLRVERTGPVVAGLMVQGKIITTVLESGESRVFTHEVTELVEGPLPDDVFRPPPDYTRVITFSGAYRPPWSDRLRMGWEMVEDWLAGVSP